MDFQLWTFTKQHIAGDVDFFVMYTQRISLRISLRINCERILNICPHLPQLLSNIKGLTFSGHSVYVRKRLHCVSKNAPTLASCSFDKHGIILIIFGKQHRHTFKNDMHIQLSLSVHLCLFYLLLNSCEKSDCFASIGLYTSYI